MTIAYPRRSATANRGDRCFLTREPPIPEVPATGELAITFLLPLLVESNNVEGESTTVYSLHSQTYPLLLRTRCMIGYIDIAAHKLERPWFRGRVGILYLNPSCYDMRILLKPT